MADKGKFKHDSAAVNNLRTSVRKARPRYVKRPAEPTVADVATERVSEPMARLAYLTQVIVEGRAKAINDLAEHLHDANMRICIAEQALGRAVPYAK